MDTTKRTLVVSSDPLVRASLTRQIDEFEGYEVVYSLDQATFLSSAEEELEELAIDILLWDLGWETGELDGLDFYAFDIPVAALVVDRDQAAEAWNAGARSILGRRFDSADLHAALQGATRGLVVFDRETSKYLLPAQLRSPADLENAPTARELEVLQLLAKGLTNRAIAEKLEISEHTVKFHINSILKKLDAQSRTEAVVIATRMGFIAL